MNLYKSYLGISRASNSKVSEKCQSLVSSRPTHWVTKWRTADIRKSLNQKLGKSDSIKVQQNEVFLVSNNIMHHLKPKLKKFL